MDYQIGTRGNIDLHGAAGHDAPQADISLALELSGLLDKEYPGHQWMVGVKSDQGVIDIQNPPLFGAYGYRILRPWQYTHDALRHEVIMAGGEMLERAHLRRGKNTGEDITEWVDGMRAQEQPVLLQHLQEYADILNE